MSLPSGYKELEYIQSSGTQYINTGFYPNQDTRVVMDVQPLNVVQTQMWCAFGARGSSFFELYKASSGNMNLTFLWGSTYSQYFSIDYTTRHTMEINKNAATVDSESKTYTATSFSVGYALYLLADNSNGTANAISSAKLYACKIYDNGTLVRNFIPCKNASGTVGLWDDANSTFYTNAGTGTFTAGAEIAGAHTILIGGTAYEITGGYTMIDGTVYPITKGRTLVDGTGYDINFEQEEPAPSSYIVTYTLVRGTYSAGLEVDGTQVAFGSVGSVEISAGSTVYAYFALNGGSGNIYIDNVLVSTQTGVMTLEYTFIPNSNCSVTFSATETDGRTYYAFYITTG